jgi:hypothetical protein
MKQAEHEHIATQQWLINNGLLNDLHKDSLYMFGAILHPGVEAVELDIDVNKKVVSYQVFVSKSLYSLIHKHETLSKDDSIIGLWRCQRLIRKAGEPRVNNTLNARIKDYCGSNT